MDLCNVRKSSRIAFQTPCPFKHKLIGLGLHRQTNQCSSIPKSTGHSSLTYVSMASDKHTSQASTGLQNLVDWCSSVGIRFNSVTIKSVDGYRGLYATEPIDPGHEIIVVPRDAAMITDTTLDSPPSLKVLRGISAAFWKSAKWQTRLAIQLLDERLSDGKSSFLQYVKNLPVSQNCVLWAFETEGREYVTKRLRDYNLVYAADKYRADVKSQFLALKKSLPRKYGDLICLRDYSWALSVVISRSFGLPVADQVISSNSTLNEPFKPQLKDNIDPSEYALLPGLDMANHSIHCKTSIEYDSSKEEYKVITGMKFDPDEEVLISYGSKSNDDLLFFYGFVEGSNPANAVKIPDFREWIMDLSNAGIDTDLWGRKLKLLKDLKLIQTNKLYEFRYGNLDEDLMRILRIAVASPAEIDKFCEQEISNPNRKTKSISLENELSAWSALSRKSEELLDQTPTLSESDILHVAKLHDRRFHSAPWKWNEEKSLGELLYIYERRKVLLDFHEMVNHYAKVSSSIGRICTVLLPPSQSLIKTDVFTSALPTTDLLGIHKFVLSDGNDNSEN